MNPPEIEQFNRQVDRVISDHPAPNNPGGSDSLTPRDARALELARLASRLNFQAAARHKAALRVQLEQRLADIAAERAPRRSKSAPGLSRLWASWASLALAAALLIFSTAHNLAAHLPASRPPLATAYIAPAMSPVSAMQPSFQKPHLQEIPRPVPTPLAPQTISYAQTAHPLRTPGSAATLGPP